ncbi:hypothetical protein ACN47E_001779 [Coniothyrium glycines]
MAPIAESLTSVTPTKLYVVKQKRFTKYNTATTPQDLFLPTKGLTCQTTYNTTNLFASPESERKILLEGRKIDIMDDHNDIIRTGVPVRALTASFKKIHDLLQVKPSITRYRVYDKADRRSLDTLLDIFTTPHGLQAPGIKLTSNNFVQNLLMYQACQTLGVAYPHTKPLLNSLRAEISARLLTKEELNTILKRVRSPDPLFKHLANDLCHRRIKQNIPDIEAFEKWVGNKKALQQAMVEIDQAHKRRRGVSKASKDTGSQEDKVEKPESGMC